MSEQSKKKLRTQAAIAGVTAALAAIAAVLVIAIGSALNANIKVVIPVVLLLIAAAGALLAVSFRAATKANKSE